MSLKNPKIACAVIALFTAVQIYDLNDVLLEKHQYFYNFSTDNRQYRAMEAIHPFWEDAISNDIIEAVVEVDDIHNPLFGNGMIDIASMCGTYNKPINSAFCARFNYHERYSVMENEDILFKKGEYNSYLYILDERAFHHSYYLLLNDRCQAFMVDGQYVMVPFMYSDDKIAEFTSMGNFEELDHEDIPVK